MPDAQRLALARDGFITIRCDEVKRAGAAEYLRALDEACAAAGGAAKHVQGRRTVQCPQLGAGGLAFAMEHFFIRLLPSDVVVPAGTAPKVGGKRARGGAGADAGAGVARGRHSAKNHAEGLIAIPGAGRQHMNIDLTTAASGFVAVTASISPVCKKFKIIII